MSTEINTTIAHRQITEKAAADLKALRERIPELEQRLTALTQEQALIEQARMDDSHTLSHAHQQDEQASKKHREALEYARYAVDTLAEQEATREALTLEAEAKEVHRLYEDTASSIEQKEAARSARLEALRVEYDQARDELTTAHAKIAEVQRIEQTALAKLGKSTYDRLLAEYQETHQAALEAAREAMAAAKIEETRFLDQALKELELWPDLQRQIRPDLEYRDELTETCQRYIDLINALIGSDQGNHLSILQQLPSIRNQYYDFRTLFLISPEDLHALSVNVHSRSTIKPISLTRRRDTMQAVISEYRKTRQ
jgi:hypothetical protein